MIHSLIAIIRNAFAEIVRQPIYAILLVTGMALIGFSPWITAYTMMDDIKLTVDMGLGTVFMVGLILSVLGATQVISDEIESKTAGAVISKPVGRFVFIAGKFIGVALALALASYMLVLMLLMTVRMGVPTTSAFTVDIPVLLSQTFPFLLAVGFGIYCNFFYRSNFTAAAIRAGAVLYTLAFIFLLFIGRDWNLDFARSFTEADAWPITLAGIGVFLGVLVISTVALAASTRVNVVANILICLTIFFLGMISNYLFGWTVDTEWVRWEPVRMVEDVTISGSVLDTEGQAVSNVKLVGVPGDVRTDGRGSFEATVRQGGSGRVRPRKKGYTFSPEERTFGNVETGMREQNFTARPIDSSLAVYARTGWYGIARAAYHAVPSIQLFWVGDQLMRPNPYVPVGYMVNAAIYAFLWCAAMVVFAAFLFEGRELV